MGPTGYHPGVFVRLADEGVPLRAIGRSLCVPVEEFRYILHEALQNGRIVEIPREDWPQRQPRSDREPATKNQFPADDNNLFTLVSRVFKTTRLESRVLLRLLRRGECTKEMIHAVVEENRGNPDDATQEKIVDVIICKLRKKLKKFEIRIETIHALGWFLPQPEREKVFAIINTENANVSRVF